MGHVRHAVSAFLILVSITVVAGGDDSLPAETVQRLKDATVYVKTEIGPLAMTGSGFVIQVTGDSAFIATNQHVVSKPKELRLGGFIPGLRGRDRIALRKLQAALAAAKPAVSVVFNSGNGNEQVIKAEFVGGLEEPDLAILKVAGIKAVPKPVEFAKSAQPTETMPVYMLGFPFGDALATNKGNPTITIGKGTVSSIRKDAAGKLAKVQIDGALNPGNSGGPVVDVKGNLVGIAVQTIQGSNIGLAIPPGELVSILEGQIGNPVILAGKSENGSAPDYEIVVPLIDPLKKLKSVSIQYVEGTIAIDSSKTGQPQLLGAAGSQKIDLTIADQTARAKLPLTATADQKTREVTVQASFVNAQGKPIHLDPQVVKVGAPAVITTTVQKHGNSTTTTITGKTPGGGTIRREVTVTRGGGSGPSKMSKLKEDEADDGDDDAEEDDSAEKKKSTPKKQIAKKGNDGTDDAEEDDSAEKKKSTSKKQVAKKGKDKNEEKDSGKTSEVGWTNKISKMKKIPDEEVTGKIDGIEFTLDKAALAHGRLVLQKNPTFRQIWAEAELDIALFIGPNDDVSGKKMVVNGRTAGAPTISISSMRKGDRLPNTQMHSDYCMILEFGDYDAELRMQPGKIYICLPDRGKSYLAGTFEAQVE